MDPVYSFLRSLPLRRGPDRRIAGICGGIAAGSGWDPALVRIATLLLFLFPGIGLGAYLLLWLLLPWQDGSIVLERLLAGRGSGRL